MYIFKIPGFYECPISWVHFTEDSDIKGTRLLCAYEDGLAVPPYAVYNIGNSNPENLLDFVDILQKELIRAEVLPADYDFDSHKELVPMQPGDVPVTFADTEPLEMDYGFRPNTTLKDGLRKFAEWYKDFYI